VAAQGGSLGAQAKQHIQAINDKMAEANAENEWKAAVQAQNSNDPNGALAQFKAIAAKPGRYREQAQAHIQEITDKLSAAADQAKFDEADRKQKSGDLAGAQAGFRALMTKGGPLAAQAADRFAQVTQLIAEAHAPKPPPPPPPNPTTNPTTNQNPTASARAGTVTLIPSGDYQRWNGPVQKGQTMPDNSIEGGLKPTNMSLPPMTAPAGATVVFIIAIDPNGNVNPVRKTVDDFGLGPQVMAAAKSWKFEPPMVKGKAVSTNIQVKVTF